MESMKKVYFPNLDGLRFYAFLAVFFAHSFWTEFDYMRLNPAFHFLKEVAYKGVLGVNFFFVLSGFLITYLLLEEKAVTGKVNIPAFYMRRILRIWPLYYFVVFVGFVVVPFVQSRLGQPTPERGNILYYLAFLGNFDVKPTSAVLGILWSIAVEEQFYLVWPVVFSIVPPRYYRFLFPVIIAISISSISSYSFFNSLFMKPPGRVTAFKMLAGGRSATRRCRLSWLPGTATRRLGMIAQHGNRYADHRRPANHC